MYKKIICVLLAAAVLIVVAVGVFATDPVSIVSKKSYGAGTTRPARFNTGAAYDMTMTIENNTNDDANYALIATSYKNSVCSDVSVGTPVMVNAGEQGTIVANISTVTGDTAIKCVVVKVENGKLYPVNQTVSTFDSNNVWR